MSKKEDRSSQNSPAELTELSQERVELGALYLSARHNYYGHYGKEAGTEQIVACEQLELHAGRGIVGDRFYDYKPDYKGQITFFALEVHEELCAHFGLKGLAPSAYRRNVMTRGVDLNQLIGKRFAIGALEFEGTEHCKPCFWMNEACCTGAEQFLSESSKNNGKGGLRARIVRGGTMELGEYALCLK